MKKRGIMEQMFDKAMRVELFEAFPSSVAFGDSFPRGGSLDRFD